MSFEILRERKPSKNQEGYEFFVRNRDGRSWSMRDLLPYMQKFAGENTSYSFVYDEESLRGNEVTVCERWGPGEDSVHKNRIVLTSSAALDTMCLTVKNIYSGSLKHRARVKGLIGAIVACSG